MAAMMMLGAGLAAKGSSQAVKLTDLVIDGSKLFDNTSGYARFELYSNGTLISDSTNLPTYPIPGQWLQTTQPGAGTGYEVRVSLISGNVPAGPALSQWHSLSTNKSWLLSRIFNGTLEAVVLVEIRPVAGSVVASATFTMTVTIET